MTRRRRAAPANFERRLWALGIQRVAGVDEAGRGALAGPVVAAAVILPPKPRIHGVTDSKRLTPRAREELFHHITQVAVAWAVAEVGPEQIDELNILRAAWLAMAEAVGKLNPPAEHALVDGRGAPGLPIPCDAVLYGDSRCYSIAAASVVAKVWRDRLMAELDEKYPGYGFARHKGYGTQEHKRAILELGPSPIHRMGFAPLVSLTQGVLQIGRRQKE